MNELSSENYKTSNTDGIQDIHVKHISDDSSLSSFECQPVSFKPETSAN